MKKIKNYRIITVLVTLLMISNISASFAMEDKVEKKQLDVSEKNVEQDIIPLEKKKKISLDEAIDIMKTKGTRAETAKLNMAADKALENGYEEKYSDIKKSLRGIDSLQNLPPAILSGMGISIIDVTSKAQAAGATSNNKKIFEFRKNFAKENKMNNYSADLNKIEEDTVAIYNGVLLAEENFKISGENLKLQEKNLKNIQLKYKVGVLSKVDVLKSESSLEKAKGELRTAKNKMKLAHMKFNFLMGFNVMQEVEFTDTLTIIKSEKVDVDDAVKNALKNRNEIKGADMAKDIYKLVFDDYKYYPKNASKYLTAKNNVLVAEKTARDAKSKIEIDIRSKKDLLDEKEAALKAAISLQEYAKEGARLVTLTHNEGLSTVQELLDVEVKLYMANLNRAKAVSEYNQAVRNYKNAQGVGNMRIPL